MLCFTEGNRRITLAIYGPRRALWCRSNEDTIWANWAHKGPLRYFRVCSKWIYCNHLRWAIGLKVGRSTGRGTANLFSGSLHHSSNRLSGRTAPCMGSRNPLRVPGIRSIGILRFRFGVSGMPSRMLCSSLQAPRALCRNRNGHLWTLGDKRVRLRFSECRYDLLTQSFQVSSG